MTPQSLQEPSSQLIDSARSKPGKTRIRVRHLSQLSRRLIVDQFRACHSTEEIAEAFHVPVRVISDVLFIEALSMRRIA